MSGNNGNGAGDNGGGVLITPAAGSTGGAEPEGRAEPLMPEEYEAIRERIKALYKRKEQQRAAGTEARPTRPDELPCSALELERILVTLDFMVDVNRQNAARFKEIDFFCKQSSLALAALCFKHGGAFIIEAKHISKVGQNRVVEINDVADFGKGERCLRVHLPARPVAMGGFTQRR